jgi:hypothetical protein
MYMITPDGRIRRIARRPRNWDALENWEDYHFIPENREWDAGEVELVVRAIGLYDIHPDSAFEGDSAWLRSVTKEFCATRHLNLSD